MGNVLDDQKQHDVRALGRLGWTLSRIADATGVQRVTAGEPRGFPSGGAAALPPLDLVATLVSDELQRREDRLLARRQKQAGFRDLDCGLDSFDFDFNKKMNRALVFALATGRFIPLCEDVLLLGPPGAGKSHLAQALGRAAIQQGYRVIYHEAHTFLQEIAEATIDGSRKTLLADLAKLPLLIIDDLRTEAAAK